MNNMTQPGTATTSPAAPNNAPAVKSAIRMGVFTLAMINGFRYCQPPRHAGGKYVRTQFRVLLHFAAVFFLVPVSLVAAELTTGWPQKGGVYRWVGEALRQEMGLPGHLASMD